MKPYKYVGDHFVVFSLSNKKMCIHIVIDSPLYVEKRVFAEGTCYHFVAPVGVSLLSLEVLDI